MDPGWKGHLTLELSNVSNLPVTLYAGMKIGQISFLRLTTPGREPVRVRRVGQQVPGPDRAHAQPYPQRLYGRAPRRAGVGATLRPALRLPNAPLARVDEEKITRYPLGPESSYGAEEGPILLPIRLSRGAVVGICCGIEVSWRPPRGCQGRGYRLWDAL